MSLGKLVALAILTRKLPLLSEAKVGAVHTVYQSATRVSAQKDFKRLIWRVISEEFASSAKGMAGLRNLLVHEYSELDMDKLVEVLNNRLDDFSRFSVFVAKYMEQSEKGANCSQHVPYRCVIFKFWRRMP